MKLLTLNFLTCATKDCRAAATQSSTSQQNATADSTETSPFPLHIRDAELVRADLDFQPEFWKALLPRVEWAAMRAVVSQVGLELPGEVVGRFLGASAAGGEGMDVDDGPPAGTTGGDAAAGFVKVGGEGVEDGEAADLGEDTLRALHELLLETQMHEGKLVCARCGHEYAVKEGIANFLLPPHLV